MAIEEITEESWGDRIKSSLTGFVVGPLLILAAFPTLFSNEGCAVKAYKGITEVSGNVVSIEASKVDKANEGKLVHVTGKATTDDVLKDAKFGVSATGVKLFRNVQMYQMRQNEKKETKKKTGGKKVTKTTYTYEKTWASSAIDSSDFKEKDNRGVNPPMRFEGENFIAKNVELDAFELNEDLIGRLSGGDKLAIDKSVISKLPKPQQAKAQISAGDLYLALGGGSPTAPAIGDYKISYQLVKPGEISIIGVQKGNTFKPYTTEAGTTELWLQSGIKDVKTMVESAESGVAMMTWIVRLVGFLMFVIGFNLLFKPLAVLGDVVPFIGSIIGGAGFLVALVLSFALSFLTISVAWLFYRPIIAVPMLLLAIGGFVFLFMRGKKKQEEAAPAGA